MTELTRGPPAGTTRAPDGASYNHYYYGAAFSAAQAVSQRRDHALKALPSFATLKEHATRADDVDITSLSSRIHCETCTKVTPLVHDVAVAVGELDDTVQAQCNKSVLRTLDYPNDNPIRTAQWILDRIQAAKQDLQEYRQSRSEYYSSNAQGSRPGILPRPGLSPQLKRPSEQWERDDFAKRSRSASGQGEFFYSGTTSITPRDERHSPAELDAASRYPNRPGSPSTATRSARALPSPSSTAYPPSTAPTTVQLAVSPTAPYTPATANSATSAHIADLQHQVTLKTLSLQTLQTEYASLLQKLQRERVKNQAIEKKTTATDREMEDLTQRNEDLADQVKTLETQLEEVERKREAERVAAAKEKEQWGRMLDMGGRLHAKGAEERQRLIEEKTKLARRVALYEGDDTLSVEQTHQDRTARTDGSIHADPGTKQARSGAGVVDGGASSLAMRREVARLNNRVDELITALKEVTRRSTEMEVRARDLVQHNCDVRQIVELAIADGSTPGLAVKPASTSAIVTVAGSLAPQLTHPTTAWASIIPSAETLGIRSESLSATGLSQTPQLPYASPPRIAGAIVPPTALSAMPLSSGA